MSVLITGGHGVLGRALRSAYPEAWVPTSAELDVRRPFAESPYFAAGTGRDVRQVALVFHLAALKRNPCAADPRAAMRTNVLGTVHAAELCHDVGATLVYTSTDYVFRGDRGDYAPGDEVAPGSYYGATKLAGEYVAASVPRHLIVRFSFFPDVFPYPGAYTDQLTTRITVTEAARRLVALVRDGATGVHHIAGKKQSVYEFALETAGGRTIQPISAAGEPDVPRDTSLIEGARR